LGEVVHLSWLPEDKRAQAEAVVGIALLWSVLWVQLAIDHGTFGTVVAISFFAIACALTVLYGMRSNVDRSGCVTRYPTRINGSRDAEVTSIGQRSSSPKAPPGIIRSSAAGVGLLGLIPWIPFSPLLGLLILDVFLGTPIALLFAAAITCVIAAGGFLLLVLLIGLGWLFAPWTMREPTRLASG
jgi:hypothetical protein